MANTNGYASPADFKKSAYTDLTLPSGLKCAARRVSIEHFVKGGRVPNTLLPMMKGALQGKKSAVPKLEDLDIETILEAPIMFDLAAIEAIVIPEVFPVPPKGEPRDDEKLYVDEIDAEDKQFIFQWAIGGVTDVAKFRDGTNSILATLRSSEDVAVPAKRAARTKR